MSGGVSWRGQGWNKGRSCPGELYLSPGLVGLFDINTQICVIKKGMIRTQVWLIEDQSRYIKDRAHSEKRKPADVLRELVDRGRLVSQGRRKESVQRFLARIERLNLSGPTDLSTHLDDYLYGDKA
jgi:hypothetical protein